MMRKVILGVAVSLDGFIEGPNGEYDWCPPPSKTEMDDFMDKIDAILMGRKSFELMGQNAFPGKKVYVFSNTLKMAQGENTFLMSGDIVSKVKEIKRQPGKDIWLFGGASVTTTFLNEQLIDEMWLGLVPIVLGAGKPLFQNIHQRKLFSVTEVSEKGGYVSLTLQAKRQDEKKLTKRV